MTRTLLVFAFEPVDELEGRIGIAVVDRKLAERLVSEYRAELMDGHQHESMRYVIGSTANLEAAEALRALRGDVGVRRVQASHKRARTSRLER